jgi:hypothetical protein
LRNKELSDMKINVPALLGATRFRIAPSIGLSASVSERSTPVQGAGPPASSWINRRDKGGTQRRRVTLCCLAAFAMSGCATTRYVTVPCLTIEQHQKLKAAEPEKIHDKLTGRADQDVGTVAGSAIRLRAWGHGLLGVLEGCTTAS